MGAAFQAWTPAGKPSSLLTRIAVVNVSVARGDEKLTAFLELESASWARGDFT
jgi:hypothetical protein